MALSKDEFKKLYDDVVHVFRDVFLPAITEQARQHAEQEVKRIIYSQMQSEIQAAIRRVVRERVQADVQVVLKEKE